MMKHFLFVTRQWLDHWRDQGIGLQGWRHVLAVGLFIQIALMVLLVSISIYLITKTEAEGAGLFEAARKLAFTQTMMQAAQMRTLDLNLAVRSADPFEREEYISDFTYRGGEFIDARNSLLNTRLTTEEKRLLDEQRRLLRVVVPIMNQAMEHLRSGQINEAQQSLNQAAPIQKKMLDTLAQLTRTVGASTQKENTIFAAQLHKTRERVLLLGGPALLITILIASAVFYSTLQSSRRLYHRANYDQLTGLLNRCGFMHHLDLAIERAKQSEHRLAIGYIDLDRFKRINDTLGHDVGDQLLVQVAARLRRLQRGGTVLGRLGGDEFAVLWQDFKSSKELVQHMKKIFRLLKTPIMLNGHELYPGCSLGISQFPHDGKDAVSLLRKADAAMYQAKKSRSRYYVYDANLDEHGEARLTLEAELRHALKYDEFFFFYQPQFEAKDGILRGVEALMRWNHPVKGVLAPNIFLNILEETGAINTVHEHLLEKACQQLSEWKNVRPIVLGFNIPNTLFWNKKLFTILSRNVKNANISPDMLELELSENLIIDDFDRALEITKRIKRSGFRIALDDFGIGMSSLSYLKRLPIDCLKIDRSFVVDALLSPRNQAFLFSILDLCRKLNIEVVAEGVETQEQLTLLRDLGCHVVQGYLLGQPTQPEKITEILHSQG